MVLTERPGPDAERRPLESRPSEEASIAALVAELGTETKMLVQQEVALARAEIKEATSHAGRVAAGFGAAGLIGYLALALLAVAGAIGLAQLMPDWLAFLIVAAVLAIIAGIAYLVGRRNLAALSPVPHKTIETLKEDARWLRARMS